ncbi:hypothetical protein DPMN_074277 [Dreissena polymorpha]|uniref:FHA domain-containing protein n=2 Tax=Dreissena polymorpha TaxID=45954 RepID=A0A9D3YFX7_DREPO|nr:hypothetical protein DPMN_074277 [Dreissena polymorpha]
MEHPSLSRHHAVIQYSGGGTEEFPRGWYLYDLDSTHGTWINKNKVPQKKFHRIHVDYVLKFGGSTRLFILQGPDTDRQEESELSVSEMKEQREKQLKEAELLRQAEMEEAERKAELIKQREELVGCSWGINENEEVEEDENAENPFAALEPENESLYINDPKKSLNSYFEREGLELPEYDFHEAGFGKWKCSIELPIDSPNGEPMVAEVVVSGKKKDAVVACALEACRILDKHGELRKSAQESRKKKGKNWEDDDFYDSDEDTYLDRTGVIEKKREMRKHKVGKSDQSTETYDTLMAKHEEITKEIEEIEAKLAHAKAQAAAMDSDDLDALDAYMSAIKSGMMDTKTKMKLKRQLMELKQEEQKVRKLVNIAKPASLPAASAQKPDIMKAGITTGIGKIKGPSSGKVVKKVVPVEKPKKRVEEEDESEEDEEDNQQQTIQSETKKESVKVQYNQDIEISTGKPKSTIGDTTTQNGQNEKVNSIKTNPRQKGPSLPLAAVLEKLQEEATEEENKMENSGEDKTMGKRKTVESSKSKSKRPKSDTGYSEDDPDYAVWLPPQNQSGDGKTHLNEKLGY